MLHHLSTLVRDEWTVCGDLNKHAVKDVNCTAEHAHNTDCLAYLTHEHDTWQQGQQSPSHTLIGYIWGKFWVSCAKTLSPLYLLNQDIIRYAVRTIVSCRKKRSLVSQVLLVPKYVAQNGKLVPFSLSCLTLAVYWLIFFKLWSNWTILWLYPRDRYGHIYCKNYRGNSNVTKTTIRFLTPAHLRATTKKLKTNKPWSEAAEANRAEKRLSGADPSSLFHTLSRPSIFRSSSPLTFILGIYPKARCLPPPPLPWCHLAHLGCLVEFGTSVPVRGAQWGPVEDTKGGLPQLPVTLRPAQQLLGVYSSVLNPHTQPYHKRTSLALAQRSPILTTS